MLSTVSRAVQLCRLLSYCTVREWRFVGHLCWRVLLTLQFDDADSDHHRALAGPHYSVDFSSNPVSVDKHSDHQPIDESDLCLL